MTLQQGGVSEPDTPLASSSPAMAPARSGEPSPPEPVQRVLGVLITVIALWAVLILPLQVVGVGFRPTDDARRHIAKVIAGKSWDQILVMRPEATVDPHPGWHAVLAIVHRAGIESATGLLVFSIVALGGLFLATPLLLRLGRDEAWLLALLVAAVGNPSFIRRILIGRPFIFTMCVLVVLLIVWPRLRDVRLPRALWIALTVLFSLSVWIHGNWYLWAMPLAAFLVAGELRVAARVAAAAAVGAMLGAAATGAPIAFLTQTLMHPIWALATDLPKRVLVNEFQPASGDPWIVAAVLALIAYRSRDGREHSPLSRDPLFLLAGMGWALGFHTQRFWWDWGLPAVLVWMARELSRALAPVPRFSRQRLLATVLIAAVLFLAVTNDRRSRWSSSEKSAFLSLDNPAHREWLPADGGILYSNQMRVFYNTFWRNPHADWRYVLGFEPALMPPADLAIYRRIQLDYASDASFAPWVAKMRLADRLVIVRPDDKTPRIPALEWHSPFRGMWIGRRPASGVPASPTRPRDEGGSEPSSESGRELSGSSEAEAGTSEDEPDAETN